MRKIFYLYVCLFFSNTFAQTLSFQLKIGDLLFQDLNCGVLCDGIGQVTYGINKTYMSHVGMVENISGKEPIIIEAIGKGVIETPLSTFLARSYDKNNHPMVIVGRLKPEYQSLVKPAVSYARKQLGKPYNASFIPNNGQSFYCSQLIYAAFTAANHGRPIFGLNSMDFTDPKTKTITPEWREYFAEIKAIPPQGKIGTNPGMISREPGVTIVYQYGNLRVHMY